MTIAGDVFVNDFLSIRELADFLEAFIHIDIESTYEDQLILTNHDIGFDLRLMTDHDMDYDLGIDFSKFKYLIIVDSVFNQKYFEDTYSANFEISKYIKNLFIKNDKESVALMDMQTLI